MVNSVASYPGYIVLLFALISFTAGGQTVTLVDNRESDNYGIFSLEGLGSDIINKLRTIENHEIASIFYVRIEGSEVNILGDYVVTRDALTFKPRFLPDHHLVHVAYVNLDFLRKLGLKASSQGMENFELRFREPQVKPTEVLNIFPAGDTVPANLLRAYMHFSAPMGLGNPYDHVKILDEHNEPVDEPFVELPEGMWDESRLRLTLFFHPGRIKRGVGPNLTKGEVFTVGERYTLVVDDEWLDGSGNKLAGEFSKSWRLTEPIRQRIDLSDWRLKSPTEAKSVLELRTVQLLDKALYPRMIQVLLADQPITGSWTFMGNTYQFLPDKPWEPGHYILKVDPKLEDVAGNTLISAFDVDSKMKKMNSLVTTIDFKVDE